MHSKSPNGTVYLLDYYSAFPPQPESLERPPSFQPRDWPGWTIQLQGPVSIHPNVTTEGEEPRPTIYMKSELLWKCSLVDCVQIAPYTNDIRMYLSYNESSLDVCKSLYRFFKMVALVGHYWIKARHFLSKAGNSICAWSGNRLWGMTEELSCSSSAADLTSHGAQAADARKTLIKANTNK